MPNKKWKIVGIVTAGIAIAVPSVVVPIVLTGKRINSHENNQSTSYRKIISGLTQGSEVESNIDLLKEGVVRVLDTMKLKANHLDDFISDDNDANMFKNDIISKVEKLKEKIRASSSMEEINSLKIGSEFSSIESIVNGLTNYKDNLNKLRSELEKIKDFTITNRDANVFNTIPIDNKIFYGTTVVHSIPVPSGINIMIRQISEVTDPDELSNIKRYDVFFRKGNISVKKTITGTFTNVISFNLNELVNRVNDAKLMREFIVRNNSFGISKDKLPSRTPKPTSFDCNLADSAKMIEWHPFDDEGRINYKIEFTLGKTKYAVAGTLIGLLSNSRESVAALKVRLMSEFDQELPVRVYSEDSKATFHRVRDYTKEYNLIREVAIQRINSISSQYDYHDNIEQELISLKSQLRSKANQIEEEALKVQKHKSIISEVNDITLIGWENIDLNDVSITGDRKNLVTATEGQQEKILDITPPLVTKLEEGYGTVIEIVEKNRADGMMKVRFMLESSPARPIIDVHFKVIGFKKIPPTNQ